MSNADGFRWLVFSKPISDKRKRKQTTSKHRAPAVGRAIQRRIAKLIEREQALVRASGELAVVFEKKNKERINRVWGER